MSFQDNELDIINFLLRLLLKEIQGIEEVKSYHIYLKNTQKFEKLQIGYSLNLTANFSG